MQHGRPVKAAQGHAILEAFVIALVPGHSIFLPHNGDSLHARLHASGPFTRGAHKHPKHDLSDRHSGAGVDCGPARAPPHP